MMKRCQNQTRVEEWEAMTNMIELEQANARILCPSRGLLLLGKVQVTQDPLKFEEEKEQPKSAWTHFLGSHSILRIRRFAQAYSATLSSLVNSFVPVDYIGCIVHSSDKVS